MGIRLINIGFGNIVGKQGCGYRWRISSIKRMVQEARTGAADRCRWPTHKSCDHRDIESFYQQCNLKLWHI